MSTNLTSWPVTQAVKGYYSSVFSAGLILNFVSYDATGTVTTDPMKVAKTMITFICTRSISMPSTSQISIKKISTASNFVVTLPKNVQLSVPPMSGSYRIQCVMPDGSSNVTGDIGMWNSTSFIDNAIVAACPFYREKLQVFEGYTAVQFPDDGRDIFVRFLGLNMEVPQFQLLSSPTDPLVGNNLVLNATTFVPYNETSIFYEPIPFEFLYTNETSPQVVVNIEGIEAVCHSLNCNYRYIQPTAQITSFSLSTDGTLLTISGTGFTRPLRRITFATFPCTSPTILNDHTITCQSQKVVGSWQPEVIDEFGIIPVVTTDTVDVSLVLSAVSPS